MECGVVIRGPDDAARFYLSAHFIEGNADVVAFFDSAGFGDKRGVPLVDRTKKELTRLFGRPRSIGKSGWEWRYGGAPCGSTAGAGHRPLGVDHAHGQGRDGPDQRVREPAPRRKS